MGQRKIKVKPAGIVRVTIILLVIILALLGLKPPSIEMNESGLKIGGLYGKLYEWDKIEAVELLNQMPQIGRRTNGMDLGSTKRGYFNLNDYGSSTLYINKTHSVFLTFRYMNKQIFVSFDDAQKGNDVYNSILNHMQ